MDSIFYMLFMTTLTVENNGGSIIAGSEVSLKDTENPYVYT